MGECDGPARGDIAARRSVGAVPVLEQRDPFVPPADEEPTVLGPLAERDPDAPLDESAEYVVTGAASFDEVLRRTRRQGFVAGAAAGGLAGAVVAAVFALATSRSGFTASATGAPAEVAVLERAASEAAPAPAPVASPARPARAATAPVAVRVAARSAAAPPRAAPPVADADRADGAGSSPAAAAPAAPAAASDRPEAVAGPAEAAALPAADQTPGAARPPQERDVTAALGARRDDLDACVAETPGDGAAAHGRRFRMLVVVEPSGQVSEARPYDEEIAATPLGVCLARLARETTFPPFEGEPARIELRVRAEE